ncbi:aldolase [Periconia macrospinosa]|uniref:deoxyribose-phosphate aldolase n=1 Tax=Periconia macrospinosa TaxID=97972 RepID=A0A2V1E2J7_9PLEO|nr:aldolase [Periconia macrospinosa]
MASSAPPTDSEIYISTFLSDNPGLDKELGDVSVMTDRYTNAEWAAQIAETQRKVLHEVEERGKPGGKGWAYEVPKTASAELARTIDHTVLKLDVKKEGIDALCSEARTEGFKSVCVRLPWVQRCVSNLKGSPVVVACVVGFHEGTQDTYSKLREARAAVAAGAAELDVVLNHSILTRHNPRPTSPTPTHDSTADSLTAANTAANSRPTHGGMAASGPYSIPGASLPSPPTTSSQANPSTVSGGEGDASTPDYSAIYRELASLRSLCPAPTVIKLILETSQLTHSQILAASHLAAAANIDFIKTSTGFNGPGATLPHVQLMVAAAEYLSTQTPSNNGSPVRGGGRKMEVKASGGIRDLAAAKRMLAAGATRLGTSSGVWIMQEGRKALEAGGGEEAETRPPATRLYTDNSIEGGY